MDIIYDVLQIGENKLLFNYTVNSDTPVFILVFTNPWTAEEKTVTLNTPDGDDGEWIFNIEGVSTLFEDLDQGKIEFEDPGTWEVSVSESGNLIKNINLQVIEQVDMSIIKLKEQTLASVDILTGFDSAIELVPAPGANKLLVPMVWNLFGDFNSIVYADNLRYELLRGSVNMATGPSDALDFAVDEIFTTGMLGGNRIGTPSTDHINQGLFFKVLVGNPTAGNSPVRSSLLYEEVDFAGSDFD